MKTTKTLVAALAVAISAVAAGAQPVAAQTPYSSPGPGINLLTNLSHEHPGAYFTNCGEINATWNWLPFWEEPPVTTATMPTKTTRATISGNIRPAACHCRSKPCAC